MVFRKIAYRLRMAVPNLFIGALLDDSSLVLPALLFRREVECRIFSLLQSRLIVFEKPNKGALKTYSTQPTIKEGGGGRKRACDRQCKVCLNHGAMTVAVAHACEPGLSPVHCHTTHWRESGLFSRAKKE